MARRSLHYAWVVAIVTFVILLVTAGIRATPGVLMLSLEREFGWSRAVISSAVAINIALFGLIGPFAASVMDRWGVASRDSRRCGLARRVRGADDADAHAVAADAVVGRARRYRHGRHLDGAGRVHRDALVRRTARARPGCAVGGQRDRAVDLPAVAGGSGRVERVAFRGADWCRRPPPSCS